MGILPTVVAVLSGGFFSSFLKKSKYPIKIIKINPDSIHPSAFYGDELVEDQEFDLATVWSAPNYCYRCGNVASVLKLDDNCERTFQLFKEVEQSVRESPQKNRVPYFL